MTKSKLYPIGIQTFSRIIREGYIYVDKTDLMWQMTRLSPFIFLSRPRRFGKSLLSTTLEAYFSGEKDLFKGLKIMQLEKDWKKYPVIRIDLSTGKTKKRLVNYVDTSILFLTKSTSSETTQRKRL